MPASHITVLVQREVGERATSTKKTSLLSLMVALASTSSRVVRRVPAGAFFPPPKVESAILEIVPMTWAEREKAWGLHAEDIMRIAKAGFASPRKKLSSNLVTHLAMTKEMVANAFAKAQLDANVRAEDVRPPVWAVLTATLSPKEPPNKPLTRF